MDDGIRFGGVQLRSLGGRAGGAITGPIMSVIGGIGGITAFANSHPNYGALVMITPIVMVSGMLFKEQRNEHAMQERRQNMQWVHESLHREIVKAAVARLDPEDLLLLAIVNASTRPDDLAELREKLGRRGSRKACRARTGRKSASNPPARIGAAGLHAG